MAGATPHAIAELHAPGLTPALLTSDKDALVKRVHRIEEQVRGIERMVDEDCYCIDILMHVATVRTALEHVGAKALEEHVTHCIADAMAPGDEGVVSAKATEMLESVQRFVKTQ